MKETVKKEIAVIDFTKFDIAQLPELKGKKKEITDIIKANPVVEVIDNASYELAKKSRTAVKTLRTSLEKEKKDVNDRIKNNVLLVVANEYDSLIADVKSDENARQEPITIWEEKKENERLEKLRLEQERVDGIKKTIGEFRQFWEDKISVLTFETIEDDKDLYSVAVVEFDRDSLAEFDVLFTDSVNYLDKLFKTKVEQLEAVEKIRLEQIQLAEEREKQRIENERIAEEQKSIAEKQRIAQEQFLKEKKEFEEKQAEAKYQERIKKLVDCECVYSEEQNGFEKQGYWIHCDDIKNASDELFERELEDAKNSKFVESVLPNTETMEVEFEEVKSDEFANYQEDDTHEQATKDLSTRLKAANLPIENEEEHLYIGTYKKLTETFASFELTFLISDLPRFENMTIKEMLSPYFNIETTSKK